MESKSTQGRNEAIEKAKCEHGYKGPVAVTVNTDYGLSSLITNTACANVMIIGKILITKEEKK